MSADEDLDAPGSGGIAAPPVAGAAAPAHDHSSEAPECSSGSGSSASAAGPRCGQPDRRVAPEGLSPQSAYEACRDQVTLKLECETASEARLLAGMLQASIFLGTTLLCAEVVLKYTVNDSAWFAQRHFAIFNVALASLCLLAMSCACGTWLRHIWLARQQVWTQRRVRLTSAYAAMLVIQIINVTFWIAPSAALLHSQCYWYSHFVDTCGLIRWTCWNTLFAILSIMAHCCCPQRRHSRWRGLWRRLRRRPAGKQQQESSGKEELRDSQQNSSDVEHSMTPLDTIAGGDDSRIVLDSPFWVHWPSAFVWVVLEADLIWQRVSSHHVKPVGNCDDFVEKCYSKAAQSNSAPIATRLLAVFFIGYSVLFIYYSLKTFRALRRSPYQLFRVGSMIARIQRQTARLAIWFVFVATGTLWFTGDTICSSYLMAWFGLAPNQIVMSALVVVLAILFMPRSATDLEPLRKVLLQEIAWDEGSRARKRAAREDVIARHPGLSDLKKGPLFCTETALKAFHFSFLSYRYEEHAGADVEAATATDDPDALEGAVPLDARVGTALQLFGLSSLEIMREATHDTKLLLGSGPGVIVLSFRGTSSAAAAWADLQVLLAKHPRQPGEASRRWPSMVHKGFQLAWTAGGFRRRVLERVRQLLVQCSSDGPPRILLTGHSLGGALAGLAAYDIHCEFDLPLGQVEVFTFGAPRLGNSTFAADYNRRVPDTWCIINDSDTITQVGKFKVYKRTGHQVIIYAAGDICVRPGPLERRLHFDKEWFAVELLLVHAVCSCWRAGRRLKHHFLSEYGFSLMMVLAAQFTSKGIAGGAQGVVDMLSLERDDTVRSLLETGGFVLEEVIHNSGFKLEADGQTVTLAAPPNRSPESEDALANVYKLAARRWRHDRKGFASSGTASFGNAASTDEQEKQGALMRVLTAPFAAVSQKFRRGE